MFFAQEGPLIEFLLHFFRKDFWTRLLQERTCKIAQGRLLQRQQSVFQRSFMVHGMGPPQGPTFVSAVPQMNKTKKQKLDKRQVL